MQNIRTVAADPLSDKARRLIGAHDQEVAAFIANQPPVAAESAVLGAEPAPRSRISVSKLAETAGRDLGLAIGLVTGAAALPLHRTAR
jgi:hypothetical protein